MKKTQLGLLFFGHVAFKAWALDSILQIIRCEMSKIQLDLDMIYIRLWTMTRGEGSERELDQHNHEIGNTPM